MWIHSVLQMTMENSILYICCCSSHRSTPLDYLHQLTTSDFDPSLLICSRYFLLITSWLEPIILFWPTASLEQFKYAGFETIRMQKQMVAALHIALASPMRNPLVAVNIISVPILRWGLRPFHHGGWTEKFFYCDSSWQHQPEKETAKKKTAQKTSVSYMEKGYLCIIVAHKISVKKEGKEITRISSMRNHNLCVYCSCWKV